MIDKPVTVRLPPATIMLLEALSIVDGSNLADQIRKAAASYIAERRRDPSLQSKIEEARERQTDVLAALTSSQSD